jgi:hypothetical protein
MFFNLLDCWNFFLVSFGFVIISAIEIICRKYFQLRKIANRTKCNSFFDIRKRIPNPRYTRLKFLADMSYTYYRRSTAVIWLLNMYWLKAKCGCKLGNWESIWKFFRKRKISKILLYGLPTFFDLLDSCNFFSSFIWICDYFCD